MRHHDALGALNTDGRGLSTLGQLVGGAEQQRVAAVERRDDQNRLVGFGDVEHRGQRDPGIGGTGESGR